MFIIVNGIEVDLRDYTNDEKMIERLEKDVSFQSDVSFGFEYEFMSVENEELSGNEILEIVVEREIKKRIEKEKDGFFEMENVKEYPNNNGRSMYSDLKVWGNAAGELWDPHKNDYVEKKDLPRPLERAYDDLWKCTGDDYLVEYCGKYYYMIDHVYNERLANDLNMSMNELYEVAKQNAKTISKYEELRDTVILVSERSIENGNMHFVSVLIDPYESKEKVERIKEILDEHMFEAAEKESKEIPLKNCRDESN